MATRAKGQGRIPCCLDLDAGDVRTKGCGSGLSSTIHQRSRIPERIWSGSVSVASVAPHEEAEAYGYVFRNRWTPVSKALQEFDTQTLEAEAFWGAEIRNKTDTLRQCVAELRTAMVAFVDDKKAGGQDFQANKEFAKQTRETVWAVPDATNKLSQRIKSAIDAIETLIRPHLRRK